MTTPTTNLRLLLSKTECDVYNLLVEGMSNKMIGEVLHITESTVKFHLTTIFLKAQCTSRSQLIASHWRAENVCLLGMLKEARGLHE